MLTHDHDDNSSLFLDLLLLLAISTFPCRTSCSSLKILGVIAPSQLNKTEMKQFFKISFVARLKQNAITKTLTEQRNLIAVYVGFSVLSHFNFNCAGTITVSSQLPMGGCITAPLASINQIRIGYKVHGSESIYE